ncbi:MAG: DUF503 domain-containing protein [Actinobacteria bacterium]|nr:DUF503 domain-containing protein [Actinomycetota bacterium]MCG2795163.1 DUF503 domain-containing protein [Actinomycetes bacterium]MBU4241216.1 DUF503 domain-containing protein [Actinomycetota bacterium]MBU4301593.1 DUF503 domain-containing protein [Actinomycetota bacterium]MBU4386148.1 DUF503 domain-containing protein [Actinomycetota bacterium]
MKFFVGIGRYRLDLKDCMSLKDKRRLIKSMVDRLGRGNLACASEIGAGEYPKSGELAYVCVSSSHEMVERSLSKSVEMLEVTGIDVIEIEHWILSPEDIMEPR